MTDGVVSVGVDPAVCVNVDGSFGVVCSGHQGIFCSNCRHSNSCKHVSYLKRYLENTSEVEMIPELRHFINLEAPIFKSQYVSKALSRNSIKFDLTPFERECLLKDHSKRFSISDNVAHLIPAATAPCPNCAAQDQWSTPYIHETTFLVTPLCCYKAEGMYLYVPYLLVVKPIIICMC